jgi:hypothetical protein
MDEEKAPLSVGSDDDNDAKLLSAIAALDSEEQSEKLARQAPSYEGSAELLHVLDVAGRYKSYWAASFGSNGVVTVSTRCV